jgi:hypothetical protein
MSEENGSRCGRNEGNESQQERYVVKGLRRLKFALLMPIVAVMTAATAATAVAASPATGHQTGQVDVFGEEGASSAHLDNTWGP